MNLQFSLRRLLGAVALSAIGVWLIVDILIYPNSHPPVGAIGQWLAAGWMLGGSAGMLFGRFLVGALVGMLIQAATIFFVAERIFSFC